MSEIDKAREGLKEVCKQCFKDSTFQDYIANRLAGDFAVEINNVIKLFLDENGKLKRQVEIYRIKIREQAIELERLEEQLQDEVRLDVEQGEFMMECVDELEQIRGAIYHDVDNYTIQSIDLIINKLKEE